jgi:hypothetical protein
MQLVQTAQKKKSFQLCGSRWNEHKSASTSTRSFNTISTPVCLIELRLNQADFPDSEISETLIRLQIWSAART